MKMVAKESGGEVVGGAATIPPATRLNGKSGRWQAIPKNDVEELTNGKSFTMAPVIRFGDEDVSHCGLGSWQPECARVFESTHVFMVVFLLGWVLQGVFYTYFVSVITTIEKLFQIKSKTTGVLLAATEVGQICTALFLTYFVGRGHRPRWIACGMCLFALGAAGCALPHFIFGSRLLQTNSVMHGSAANLSFPSPPLAVCDASFMNMSSGPQSSACEASVMKEQAAHSQMTSIVLPIFFMCLFAVGVGQTAICTLGIPYIDDNVASRESPLYLAITIGVRIVGPAGGFILGSFCTRIYANLSTPSGLHTADPRWVGAWWLGLILVSTLLALMGLMMFCFPRQLPGSKAVRAARAAAPKPRPSQEAQHKAPQLKDFPKTLKRQLSNDILMCRTASCVLHLLPVAGLYTFLPKYLESQFRLAAHEANLISGVGGIMVMGVGIMLSGAVILKLVPTARFVAGWIAFTSLAYASGMLILMFVGCPMDDLVGLQEYNVAASTPLNSGPLGDYHQFFNSPVCKSSCNCDKGKFGVICGQDGKTYFSACHAGCHNVTLPEQGNYEYYNCDCINPESNYTSDWTPSYKNYTSDEKSWGVAKNGYCTGNCKKFTLFMCIFSFIMFIHSTGEVGSILLIMRCTDPKDKAMAMGIIQFAIGLFGNVPCPIIFGAVVDSACLLWDSVCNTKGACFLYDSDVFRHFFLGTTGGIMGLAFLIDLVVWYKASRIDINPEADTSDAISTKSKSNECIPRTLPHDLSTTPLTTPAIALSDM